MEPARGEAAYVWWTCASCDRICRSLRTPERNTHFQAKASMPAGTLSEFLARHWVIGGIVASLAWFVAGGQSFSNRKPDAAVAWQSVAVLIILILCGWMIKEGEWLGLGAALGVLYLEVRTIRRILAAPNQQLPS